MYAVIFRAKTNKTDTEYHRMAEHLRELAFNKYGCLDFVSVTEGKEEVAISYWSSLQQIRDWKNDPQHQRAQIKGRDRWYSSYSSEICEVVTARPAAPTGSRDASYTGNKTDKPCGDN